MEFLHPAVMCAKLCEIRILGLALEMLSLSHAMLHTLVVSPLAATVPSNAHHKQRSGMQGVCTA